MQYKVKWLGYLEDQSTWEPEENILDKCLIEHFEQAKDEISKNPVYSMVESQFSICLILRQCCVRFNQQINCIFIAHDKPDSSFATFINLSRGSDFMLSDNER